MKRVILIVIVLIVGIAAMAMVLWPRPQPAPTPNTPPDDPPWFTDVTEQVGLIFTHDAGPTGDRYFMPQIVGSGGAFLDMDGDGRLDIYLVHNGGPQGKTNQLFQQQSDGTFRDVSRGSGLDVAGFGMGVTVGDINNDGRPDVLVTEYGQLRLFRNDGQGRFTPFNEAGVTSQLWGTSAAFTDYDRDGRLDLVVGNYVDYDPAWPCTRAGNQRDYCHPQVFRGTATKLFRNISDRETIRFEDVTVRSGLGRTPGPALGAAAADFNGDGWPDFLIANDGQPNHLWINQQNGTFREEALTRGIAYDGVSRALANMGIAIGDVRQRGLFDVFITHLPEETNTYWQQESAGLFTDRTAQTNLLRAAWRATGFGTCFVDFNHDGFLDLAIVNGRVARHRSGPTERFWDAYTERNQLFRGEAKGRFQDISEGQATFCRTPNVARALVYGDVDNDGAVDLLYTTIAGEARLLRNVAPQRGHWLNVRALAKQQRDAYGATIIVEAEGRTWHGWVTPSQSYLCSHDPRVHVGLGANTRYQRLRVRWPDGTHEAFAGGEADRFVIVQQGKGQFLPEEAK